MMPTPRSNAPGAAHPFEQLLELERRGRLGGVGGVTGALALAAGGWRLLLPLDEILEVVPPPRLTRVPGVQPWLVGIASLRGHAIGVTDLGGFLGSARAGGARTRLVLTQRGPYGLLVDEVFGTRPFGERRPAPPETLAPGLRAFIGGVVEAVDGAWLAFELGRLCHDPRFLAAAT